MSNEQTKQIKVLIEALDTENADEQQSKAIELIEFGAIAVDDLINALKHDSWRVRYISAWALGEIGDERAVMPLITALHDDNNDVQDWAAKGIRRNWRSTRYSAFD